MDSKIKLFNIQWRVRERGLEDVSKDLRRPRWLWPSEFDRAATLSKEGAIVSESTGIEL
jgi:hypothetical protein